MLLELLSLQLLQVCLHESVLLRHQLTHSRKAIRLVTAGIFSLQ
jgi:hypothetical protein